MYIVNKNNDTPEVNINKSKAKQTTGIAIKASNPIPILFKHK